jgi:cytochrome c
MTKKNIAALAIATATAAGFFITSAANASEDLFKKSGCVSCHAVDKKLVGPSLKDIATKYKTQKGADTTLAGKIRKGSAGVWGVIPMPANAAVSDEDALTLSKWVLTQ